MLLLHVGPVQGLITERMEREIATSQAGIWTHHLLIIRCELQPLKTSPLVSGKASITIHLRRHPHNWSFRRANRRLLTTEKQKTRNRISKQKVNKRFQLLRPLLLLLFPFFVSFLLCRVRRRRSNAASIHKNKEKISFFALFSRIEDSSSNGWSKSCSKF